jgi:His/Glu/Gln/Arg/opine family amino acid ABC transporter permease subunit
MDFAVIWNYLPYLIAGAWITLKVSILTLLFGAVMGLCVAFMRLSTIKLVSRLAWGFVWFVRGTPLLLQIFAIYYWLPSAGILLPAFIAGVAALSIHAAAYFTDIFRAAIIAVPRGQIEAAQAVGMTPFQIMWRITLPLSARPALPPFIGESINIVKGSSLVSVISVQELMFTSQSIYSSTYKMAEILGSAGLIYLVITSALTVFQGWLEQRLSYYTVR